MTDHPRATGCPTCARRLRPLPPANEHQICRWLCLRCGTTGVKRASDGVSVWAPGGDGSAESRQARAAFKADGLAQMRGAKAAELPGMGEGA